MRCGTGVVHQDIETGVNAADFVHQGRDVAGLADVAVGDDASHAPRHDLVAHLGKLVSMTRADRQVASLTRKLDRGCLADSHARTSHQRHPALESQIHF